MAKAVADEYKSSLADLNFNSKPHINMLTMLAEENISNASVIVQAIVDHIEKSPSGLKLPGFYLVDSIIKNVGKEYVPLFCQHIIRLFTSVFEKVDEGTRSLLFKLRQTWNGPLPCKVLYGLDLQIRKMDPAWPITAKPPTKGIHVNPKFLAGSSDEKKEVAPVCVTETSPALKTDDGILQKHGEVLKQLREKKGQLIEKKAQLRSLEMKKLEISSKKKMKMLSQEFNNQNFKPNTFRDPRMVKINKTSASPSKKASGSSPDSKKTVREFSDCIVPNVAKKTLSIPEKPKKSIKSTKSDAEAVQNNFSLKLSPKSSDLTSGVSPAQSHNNKCPAKHDPGDLYEKFKLDTFSSNSTPMKQFLQSKHVIPSETSSKQNDSLLKCDKSDIVQSIDDKPEDKNNNLNNRTQKSVPSTADKNNFQQTKSSKENSKTSQKLIELKNTPSLKKVAQVKKGNFKNDHNIKNVYKGEKQSDLIKEKHSQLQSDNRKGSDLKKVVPTDANSVSHTLKRSSKACDTFNEDDVNERQLKKPKLIEKQSTFNTNIKGPPVLFGNEDQDQRRSKLKILDPNIQGWAEYKAAHPDEFRSPITPTQENNEGRFKYRRMSFSSSDMNRFHSFNHDRFPRFRFPRGRFIGRYFGRRPQFFRGPRGRIMSPNFGPLMLDPHVVLAQAEEKYHNGHISKGEYLDLCHDLQKMLESRDYQRYKERMSRIQSIKQSRLDESSGKFRNNDRFGFPENRITAFQKDDRESQDTISSLTCTNTFTLDGKVRTVQFMNDKAFVIMDNQELKELSFKSDARNVFIEGLPEPIPMNFDGKEVQFTVIGNKHSMKFGTPAREIYIDNHPYQAQFGGPPISILLDGRYTKVVLSGPPPQVIVSKENDYNSAECQEDYGNVPKPTRHFDKDSSSLNADLSAQDIDMRVTPGDMTQASLLLKEVQEDAKDVDWRILPGRQIEMRDPCFNIPLERDEQNNLDMQKPREKIHSTYNERNTTEGNWHNSSVPIDEWTQNVMEKHSVVRPERNNLNRNFEVYDPNPRREKEYFEDCSQFFPKQHHVYNDSPEAHQHFDQNYDRFSNIPRGNWRHMTSSWRPAFFERHPRSGLRRPPRYGPRIQRNIRPGMHDWWPDAQSQEAQESLSFVQDSLPSLPLQATNFENFDSSNLMPEGNTSIPASSQNVNENPGESELKITEISQESSRIDVEALFEKLMAAGIINTTVESMPVEEVPDADKVPKTTENSDEMEAVQPESIPEIEFKTESLKIHYPGVISALHQGSQCCSCGVRFKEIQSQHYSQHLDWHFRLNRKEKEGSKKPVSKRWYYEVEDWAQFEEFEDCEERAPSFFDLQAENVLVEPPSPIIPSVAATDDISEECSVCSEPFQLFWVQDEEEWHLKNAIRVDNQAYHPACYEDFKKAQEAQNIADVVPEEKYFAVSLEEIDEAVKFILDELVEKEIMEVVNLLLRAVIDEVEQLLVLEAISKSEEILEGKPGVEEIIGLITESEMESESNLTPVESKMVVMQSGGITLKVKAESLQSNSSAKISEADMDSTEGLENAAEEFRPPTPDPKFQVMPPVSKGSELSGLCSIM